MRRIRLALVAGNLDDSADRLLSLLGRRLHAQNYDVSLYRLAPGTESDQRLREAGVRVVRYDDHFRYDMRIGLKLADEFSQTHTDAVYTWGRRADAFGRMAAVKSGVPVVLRAVLGTMPQTPVHKALNRLFLPWTMAHVTFSRGMADYLCQQGCKAESVHVIQPGIEPPETRRPSAEAVAEDAGAPADDLAPPLPKLPEDTHLVLASGQIDRHQGLLRLLWAMGLIRYSGLKVHLWIAGEGSDVQPLQHEARQMGIDDLVHFIGRRHSLDDIWPLADVFAMPTRHEVLNLAPLQAMWHRVPIVLARSPGSHDVSGNGRFALLADADHPKDIASAIYRQLCDKERIEQMVENARHQVAEHHTAERFVASHDDLLSRLVASKVKNLSD